jgi:hypothetical protein
MQVVTGYRKHTDGLWMFLHRSSLNILKDIAMKVHGLNQKWNRNFILGYSDTETVKLDFDRMPLRMIKYWALRTMK